jgi:putative hydrolase of the HAD superfamily
LGLLTNGLPGVQRFKAKQAGLLSYFDSVVVSGDLETGKPDPILFETVLGGMGVQASHAIMVGDRIATDIAGARAAGMRTILIRRDDEARAGDAKPDWTINGLDELHDCLKAAGGLAYANRHLDGEDS